MLDGIDPNQWVDAWQRFVSTTPIAGWSSTIIVGIILLMIFVKALSIFAQGVIVPIVEVFKRKK